MSLVKDAACQRQDLLDLLPSNSPTLKSSITHSMIHVVIHSVIIK